MKGTSSGVLPTQSNFWRPGQVGVVVLAVLCLGILVGYLFHSAAASSDTARISSGSPTASETGADSGNTNAIQPLLERLRSNPSDPDLLASIGNAYYDQHSYDKAIGYYRRYLQINPQDASVRTDMGTAIWYNGDPDEAIQQYETALRIQPDFANALFNTGIVKWQGKHDRWGALQSWQKLLSAHPDYPNRQKVEQLMQQVQTEINQTRISPR